MSGAIRFPFRLDLTGKVSTADYGSDQEVNDAIAASLYTQQGERPLAASFGITDPAGLGIDEVAIHSDLATNMSEIGFDDVTITDVRIEPVSDVVAAAVVEWERDEEPILGDEEEDEEV